MRLWQSHGYDLLTIVIIMCGQCIYGGAMEMCGQLTRDQIEMGISLISVFKKKKKILNSVYRNVGYHRRAFVLGSFAEYLPLRSFIRSAIHVWFWDLEQFTAWVDLDEI